MEWKLEHREDGATWIGLSGEITENSDFAPILGKISNLAVFDLSDVNRINSCGVREWIHFVTSIGQAGKRLVLERCSVPFVHQLNMITNFAGQAEIHSIFAPYFCPACGSEAARVVDLRTDAPVNLGDAPACEKCGTAMEFDDMPESYLTFRKT